MTTFYLIRHATTDAVTGRRIAGRAAGVHLNEEGRAEAEALAARLAPETLKAVYSSPLERALETAEPIARTRRLEVQTLDALNELQFGQWTGRTFEELEPDAQWHQFNSFRSGTRIPGGEMMIEAQARIVNELERLSERHRDEAVAVVSHGDLIKAAVAHYAGIHLDMFWRIEISPASVSIVELNDYGPRVLLINGMGRL